MAHVLDADAALAALTPPVLKIGGTDYPATHLVSWKEALAYSKRIEAMVATSAGEQVYADFAVEVANAVGWPGERLLELPSGMAWGLINDFLRASWARAEASPTSGNASPPAGSGD